MLEALALGLGIGLAAGVSPGPLLTLTLSATLERGFGAGLRVASAPLFSDLPILVICFGLLSQISETFLGGVGLIGGAFVIFLGFDAVAKARKPLGTSDSAEEGPPRDLLRASVMNFFNPNPWIFWITVGGPQVVLLWRESSPWAALGFCALFYVGLVGVKVLIVAAVARGRRHLDGPWYRRLLMACGGLLWVFGLLLAYDGWQRLALS